MAGEIPFSETLQVNVAAGMVLLEFCFYIKDSARYTEKMLL
jgi:hypothetical protein